MMSFLIQTKQLSISMQTPNKSLWEKFSPTLQEKRRDKMHAVASNRTKHIRLVLQDIHDPHNISACLRSADAFGIQEIDIISYDKKFKVSSVAKGCHDWLTLNTYDSIAECSKNLKEQGFKLFAAMPSTKTSNLHDLEVRHPLAIIFGNEHAGVSDKWNNSLDGYFAIPMVGFVDSLNISVSAAITMQHLTQKCLKELSGEQFFLNDKQRLNLLDHWLKKKYPNPKS